MVTVGWNFEKNISKTWEGKNSFKVNTGSTVHLFNKAQIEDIVCSPWSYLKKSKKNPNFLKNAGISTIFEIIGWNFH